METDGRNFTEGRVRRFQWGLPPKPTEAMPGSAEKVAVLAQRARLGVGLWHPDDAGVGKLYRAKGYA